MRGAGTYAPNLTDAKSETLTLSTSLNEILDHALMLNGKIMLNIYIYIFCLSEEIHYFHLASPKMKDLPRKAFREGK